MKTAIIVLMACASCLFARDAKPIDATVSRLPGGKGEIAYKIECRTAHEAKLGANRGKILQQRIVSFYDNGTLVGSYFHWQEVGSGLPDAVTEKDLHTKPKSFNEVRVKDYFYDVNWRDGHVSEKELGRWFTQTWHQFNSCDPNSNQYYLCKIDDIPRMDGFLEGAGFTVYAVLSHTFTLPAEGRH